MSDTTPVGLHPAPEVIPDLDQVRAHFLALQRPGEVREVRILDHIPLSGYGAPATASGYFDNPESLAAALDGIGSQHATGIYITQNPVDPDLLARANNRLHRKAKQTTADADIIRLAHLTLDFDPARKSGISATDTELTDALSQRAAYIRFVTSELGWPEPLVCMMSGNGGQATWRIDLPVDANSTALIHTVLEVSSTLFSTPAVSVDTTLGNPSRIVKLSGTVAAKGDALPHRPHRRAHSAVALEAGVVSEAHLRALTALAPEPQPSSRTGNGRTLDVGIGATSYDVPALLTAAGIGYRAHDKGWGLIYELDRCLSSEDHNDGAAILQFSSGAVAYHCFHKSCTGVTWRDVKSRLGIPAPQNGSDAREFRQTANGHHGSSVSFGSGIWDDSSAEDPWPPMADLPPPTPPVPTMSAAMVPEPYRARVVDIADLTKLPLEMVAVPMITAAGAVVGRAVGVRPGQYDDFTVVPNLWGAVIARPGWLKSTAIKEAFRPLGRLADAARSAHEVVEDELAVKREGIDAEIRAIKDKMREAAKKSLSLTDLQADLTAKRAELKAATATERRFVTNDPSVEKLGELLRDNPRGMLVQRDELAGWLQVLDKPGREGDREFYLEAWNGTGSYTVDRIGRGTIHIPSLTLSLFGGIQPGKLEALVASAVHGGFGDDGLLQRFQLAVWPDRLPPWSKPTRRPDKAARDRVVGVFESLAAMVGASVGATNDDIPFLRFSPFTQTIADDWRDALEHRLRSDELDDTPAFASHLAKYRSLMPALALLFYLIDLAAKAPGTSRGAVAEQHVRLAIEWCTFLEAHARKLYAPELHAGVLAAHALAAKIEAGAVCDGQSVRELYRAQWAQLRTPERVRAGLDELTDRGWVRLEFALTGGRSTESVRLHPDLVEQGKTDSDTRDPADQREDASDA